MERDIAVVTASANSSGPYATYRQIGRYFGPRHIPTYRYLEPLD